MTDHKKHLEHILGITDPLKREIDKITRPVRAIDEITRPVRDLDKIVGRNLFTQADLTAKMLSGANAMQRLITPMQTLLASFQGPLIGNGFADMIRANRSALELDKIYDLGRSLAGLEGVAAHLKFTDGWQSSYCAAIDTSRYMLDQKWLRPTTGILAALDAGKLTASLSWMHSGSLFAAALVPRETPEITLLPRNVHDFELPKPAPIAIKVMIKCVSCGNDMQVIHEHLELHGPRDGIFEVEVAPVCLECWQREQGDPSYIDNVLNDLSRPRLRLIEGDGQGSGEPAGMLRLVAVDEKQPESEE